MRGRCFPDILWEHPLFFLRGTGLEFAHRLCHTVDDLVPLKATRLENGVGDGGALVSHVLLEGVRVGVLVKICEGMVDSAVASL